MSEYGYRRKKIMQAIGEKGILILSSAPEVYRNGDALYPYRQNSDFYYLTGFEEPESILVLAPSRKEGEFILFNRVQDKDKEIWDGPRAGQAGAIKSFHADQAFPFSEFSAMLPALLAGREAMDITLLLHEMRLLKSEAEIAVMQKAVDITDSAHRRAMQTCKPNLYEYELEAEIMYEFQRQGARYPAYASIVGAGRNSCILHYVNNQQKMADGDLVLVDAGCEYQYYASDITRTFPVNGKFSGEQRAIYELVLASQLAAIQTIKPQSSWQAAQDVIVKIITQGLIDLRILKGDLTSLIEKQAYLPFYMHKSGHWLGLDVHDVGLYHVNGKPRPLEANMVLTVEPGIYISGDIEGVDKRWHHIGVRIEDDVWVTDTGCKVLSANIPKTISDIESIMAS